MQKKKSKPTLTSSTPKTKPKKIKPAAAKKQPPAKSKIKSKPILSEAKIPSISIPAPKPSSRSKEERNWDMYCHLAALSGFIIPLGFILGPLIVWLIKREEFPSVDKHGKAALNFQISMTIYFIISILLAFIVIGFVLIVALIIMEIVFVVLASIKAQEGGFYQYPLSISFIK